MFTIDEIKEYFNNLPIEYEGYDSDYKFIINNIEHNIPFAFSRFNDGEMLGIDKPDSVVSRGAQLVDSSLQNALKKSITHKQENYYIGIPCPNCYPEYHKLANELIGEYDYKVRAVCNINRNYSKFINEFITSLKNKNIIWVGGDDQNVNNLTYVLDLKIEKSFLFSKKNAWEKHKKIQDSLSEIKKYDIVLFSLGPTGRILSQELFKSHPYNTFIDIGSLLDPITRNVWHNYHKGWEKGFNNTKECKICN